MEWQRQNSSASVSSGSVTDGAGSLKDFLPLLSRGRGMGRGRFRRNDTDSLIAYGSVCSSVRAFSETQSIQNGQFDDVEEDTIRHSQQNGNSQTSLTVGTSLIKPEPINKKGNSNDPLLDLKRNIPSRLLKNNKTSLSVPARIISVDADKRLGYIIFDDSITVAERERISKIMETTYKSEIGELVIPPEDVVEHQVHIFKDRDGILHRAMLIKKNLIKSTFKLLDVDTTQTFITLKLEAFKMVPEVSNFWFQAVPSKLYLNESQTAQSWKSENSFICRNKMLMENSLISALEINLGKRFSVSDVEKLPISEEGALRVSIDVFSSRRLKFSFLHSIAHYSVPRMPTVGQAKVGLITNLRNSGRVEVVFADHYYELLEALTTVQITNQLFDYHCNVKQEFVKSIIQSSRVSTFLAPYNHDWDEIHRVRILKMEESRQLVRLHFIDTGKEMWMSINEFAKEATPINSKIVPEALQVLPPQAVTVTVNRLNVMTVDSNDLLTLRELVEGKTCYVKRKSADDPEPLVDIYTVYEGEVRSLHEIVQLTRKLRIIEEATQNGQDLPEFKDDFVMKEEVTYDLLPLNRFTDKIKIVKQHGVGSKKACSKNTPGKFS